MQALVRLPDWQSRFDACVRARRAKPFGWGSQDCILFAADSVQSVTGVDLAASHRGYAGEYEARRLLARLGGVDVIATEHLGQELDSALRARVADVAVVVTAGGRSLAVCGGGHWLVPGEHGLFVLPFTAAVRAWRVG